MKTKGKRIMPVLLVAAIIITTAIVSAAVVTAEELDYTTYCMIDFSSYTLKAVSSTVQSGNARSNAGAFSVESDSDAAGGKYLKYKRNSTITSAVQTPAVYMFLLNPSGSYTSSGATILKPNAGYTLTMRYKVTGLDENQVYQFRIYNTADKKYSVGNADVSTSTIVFASTGNKQNWVTVSYNFTAPAAGVNGYTLAGCFVPHTSVSDNSNRVDYYAKNWELSVDYIDIVETEEINQIDFSKYNADFSQNKQTVRNDAGEFSLEADENAEGGKYLKYVRSTNTSLEEGENPALYMFMLNRRGGHSKNLSYSLESEKEYSFSIKYKITNTDTNASSQRWQFRLYYTQDGYYTSDRYDEASAVKVFQHIGNTDGFVTETYRFTAPERTSDDVSLIACFIPVSSDDGISNSNVSQIASYEFAIDFITFGEAADLPPGADEPDGIHTVDFNKYWITTDPDKIKASVRTEAGEFSIGKDNNCSNGSYLKFKRNDTVALNKAFYMFQLNKTGGYTKDTTLHLTPGVAYIFTIRYRVKDFPENVSYQFCIYNAKNYSLLNWDSGTSGSTVVFASSGNTDDFVTETYYFNAPDTGGEQYSALACFAPVAKSDDVNNSAKSDVFNYEIDIDYIDINLDPDGDTRIPSFVNYPLDEKYLTEVSADEESTLVFKGKDSSFWSNQFDGEDPRAISYSWTRLEKNDPNYQKFQSVNTITMLDHDIFYKDLKKANFITAFQAGIIDITPYIKTGNIRFWVKTPHDIKVKISLTDEFYKRASVSYEFKETSDNNGFTEVVISLRDFYDSAVAENAVWNHSKIWAIEIFPQDEESSTLLNEESVVFSPWQIWSKEPLETHVDLNRYFYAQVGCDIKIRDLDDIMPSTTVLRAFRNTLEEDSASRLISEKYKNGKLLQYWAIYALSSTTYDSRIEQPYDTVDLMIPYTDEFKVKNLCAGLISDDGSISVIPMSVENGWLVLKTQSLGNIAFFTADGIVNSLTDNDLSQTGDKTVKVMLIWISTLLASAFVIFGIMLEKFRLKRTLNGLLSLMLCVSLIGTVLCGCGDDASSSGSKKKKIIYKKRDTTSDVSSDETDSDDSNSDYVESDDTASDNSYAENDEESETDTMKMELRIANYHPGIPGYDAEYEFRALVGTEMDMTRIPEDEFILSCSIPEIKINGNKITVPASFKDNTNLGGVMIYARYKDNPNLTAGYPFTFVKWNITFGDDFDGTELDRTKWTDQKEVYHTYADMRNGTTNIRLDDYCYFKNGNLVMPIVKNTEQRTWQIETDGGKKTFQPDYVSSEIRTDFTFAQEYGCFTVRMKGPAGSTVTAGTNNAFWLLPYNGNWGKTFLFDYESGNNEDYSCGEIDVVERSAYWGNGLWQNTQHIWNSLTGVKKDANGDAVKLNNTELMNGDYIEYTAVWTRDALYTYANGKLVRTTNNISSCSVPAYMILSNNLNSMNPDDPAWTGYATDADLEDLTVYVDYVRVYSAEK